MLVCLPALFRFVALSSNAPAILTPYNKVLLRLEAASPVKGVVPNSAGIRGCWAHAVRLIKALRTNKCFTPHLLHLWNNNCVSRMQSDIISQLLSLDNVLVVERQF